MGAKFTIVLDTEDPQGLRDALEIAIILNKNHRTDFESSFSKVKFGKVALIKMVRDVARRVEQGKQSASLRDSKDFVEELWTSLDFTT